MAHRRFMRAAWLAPLFAIACAKDTQPAPTPGDDAADATGDSTLDATFDSTLDSAPDSTLDSTIDSARDGTAEVAVDAPDAIVEDTPPTDTGPITVEPSPSAPKDDGGNVLPWTSAPQLADPTAARGSDSAILVLPAVSGARDYRVFAIPAGVQIVSTDGVHEDVRKTTIFCAGYRQRNVSASAAPPELLRRVEVAGLTGPTRFVIEAIDTPCPFAGVRGSAHADIVVDNPEVEAAAQGTFSISTEAEIVSRYGSMIVNGHGAATKAAQPAPPILPKVLARTTVNLVPVPNAAPTTFFEDFSGSDPPVLVGSLPNFDRSQNGTLYRNSKFNFVTYGAAVAQFVVDRKRLNVVLADWGQDIMASAITYPRKPVHLSASTYLHVTFRVASDSTQRRYWWIVLCGAATAGQTIDASGALLGNVIQTPFFYQADGLDPSMEGWNCLQVFPRDGAPYPLPPSNTQPESDVRVMVNKPAAPVRDNVVNVSPDQYGISWIAPSWYRQRDTTGALSATMLDDQLLIAPTARLDLYIRRDRVVMYVDGEQRLCNDFPTHALTMADGALGFGQVLYHSAAERQEFSRSDWDRTAQRYYLQNTPFVDVRAWDDLGYSEGVAEPAGFVKERCHVASP
jgi:hypothetical protein